MKKLAVCAFLVVAAAALAVVYIWYFSNAAKLERVGKEFLATGSISAGGELSVLAVKAGPKATPILLELLRNPNLRRLGYVVDALGALGPLAKDAVPDLLRILVLDRAKYQGRPLPEGRRSLILTDVVSALGKIKDERAAVPICSLISKHVEHPYLRKETTEAVVVALANFGPAAKVAIPKLSTILWQDYIWRDKICDTARDFAPEIRSVLEKECSDHKILVSTEIQLLSPPNGSSRGGTVTFAWAYKLGMPGATYCPTVITDKGPNPFDGWYERAYKPKKNAVSLTAELDYSRYEWGVLVWACRDKDVDCSANEKPTGCVEVSSDVNVLQAR